MFALLMLGSAAAPVRSSAEGHTESNIFTTQPLYVSPDTSASRAVIRYPEDARDISVIADTPQARWFDSSASPESVQRYVVDAAAADAIPVVVTYGIPHRDCGSYSAGGFTDPGQYRAWIDGLGTAIGDRTAAVIVEPDALTATTCLDPADTESRLDMLRHAVSVFADLPHVAVYLDGGHSRWLSPPDLASMLAAVGVDRIRGFSLDVANFFSTAEESAYGETVSSLLGGKHYVIDTSRNGNGPAPDAPLNWCNPPGRALGDEPTAQTDDAHADAYLWVKHPGESDGTCDRGDPPSSVWWQAYAVDLVRNSGR